MNISNNVEFEQKNQKNEQGEGFTRCRITTKFTTQNLSIEGEMRKELKNQDIKLEDETAEYKENTKRRRVKNVKEKEQSNSSTKRKIRSTTIPSSPKNPSNKRREGVSHGNPTVSAGDNIDIPMVIDSDHSSSNSSDSSNDFFDLRSRKYGSSSKLKHATVKKNIIQRQLLHPYHILLPVPLSTLQQIRYNMHPYERPKELNSESLETLKDDLLKIINLPGTNGSYELGKLKMMRYLLDGLRNCELTLGIAIPQDPIMKDTIEDFMKEHKFSYKFFNEPVKKVSLKKNSNGEKLLCVVFTAPLPKAIEKELPPFELIIAYDTSFNPKKHLLHTKTNENIPTIRFVTENTLEHALNYFMNKNQDNFLFSNLPIGEMAKIISFGLDKDRGEKAGRESSKTVIKRTCDKVFQWINDGMLKNLTFGMEDAVKEVWGKSTFDKSRFIGADNNGTKTNILRPSQAEKRISEVSDEGNLKRRKDKEVAQNDDFQKKKKLKLTKGAPIELVTSTTSSSTDPLTDLRDDSYRDLRKNLSKDSFKERNSDSTPDTFRNSKNSDNGNFSNKNVRSSNKDYEVSSKEQTIEGEWKQKYMELLAQDKLKDEKIENLTRENDKYCRINFELNNSLNTELVKIKDHFGIKKSKKSLIEIQSIELEKTRMELTSSRLENISLQSDIYSRDQEICKLREEIANIRPENNGLKSNVKNKNQEKSKREIKTELDKMRMENSELKSVMESKDQEINRLRREIKTQTDELDKMRADVKNKDQEINQLEEKIETQVGELDEMRTDVKDKDLKINQLGETIKTQVNEIDKVRTDVKGKDREINQLEEKIKTQANELEKMRTDVKNKDRELNQLWKDIDELGGKSSELKLDAKNKDQEIDKLKLEMKKMKTELDKVQAVNIELKSNEERKDQEINKLRGEICEFRTKNTELESVSESKDQKIKELEKEIEIQIGKFDKIQTHVNKLREEIDKLRTKNTELKSDVESKYQEINKLRTDIKTEPNKLRAENIKLKSDAESKYQEINMLRKKIETQNNKSEIKERLIKEMEAKIDNLETENRYLSNQYPSTSSRSLEDQVQKLEKQVSTLKLQCNLQENHLKLADEDKGYYQDITKLLLEIKGKTEQEMKDLAKKHNLSSTNINPNVGKRTSNETKLNIAPGVSIDNNDVYYSELNELSRLPHESLSVNRDYVEYIEISDFENKKFSDPWKCINEPAP